MSSSYSLSGICAYNIAQVFLAYSIVAGAFLMQAKTFDQIEIDYAIGTNT
ncbi:hypothetical protein [Methylomicrobium lacus]